MKYLRGLFSSFLSVCCAFCVLATTGTTDLVFAASDRDIKMNPPAKIKVRHPARIKVEEPQKPVYEYVETGSVLQYQVDSAEGQRQATDTASKERESRLKYFEPLKNGIWNADTIPQKIFVLHPMFSYLWAGSRYDDDGDTVSDIDLKKVTLKAYAFYGVTDRLEAGTSLGLASRQIDRSTGSDSETGLLDLSFIARYALVDGVGFSPFRLTAGFNVVAPIGNDELTGGDFKFGPMMHATYTIKPVNIYGNLGYTFRGSDGNTDYGNVFNYAFGGEYFLEDYDLSFILAFLGEVSADNKVNGIKQDGSGPSKLEIMPAVTYKIPNSDIALMSGFSVTLFGKSTNKTNTIFVNIQWLLGNL